MPTTNVVLLGLAFLRAGWLSGWSFSVSSKVNFRRPVAGLAAAGLFRMEARKGSLDVAVELRGLAISLVVLV
jgi:hypothetical protein